MEYKILTANSYQVLEVIVNRYIRNGWQLAGGVSCSVNANALWYLQAMTLTKYSGGEKIEYSIQKIK